MKQRVLHEQSKQQHANRPKVNSVQTALELLDLTIEERRLGMEFKEQEQIPNEHTQELQQRHGVRQETEQGSHH